MSLRVATANLLGAWLLMMPPASGPPASAVAHLEAPLSQWNLAGRFFLRDTDHQKECEKTREAFIHDGERLATMNQASLIVLATAEKAAKCVPLDSPQLNPALAKVLDEPFWLSDFARYPAQTASRVMVSSMLIMPPATGRYGRLKARLKAPLSQWNLAGDFATPEECDKERRELWIQGKALPVNEAVGLRPLAAAEMNARCVKPDDPRVKGVIPWNGLMEPPIVDVPYLNYPDQNSRDYFAPDMYNASDTSPAARRSVVSFPSATNKTLSPDGRYLMTNVDNPEEMTRDEEWHSLFLTDTRTRRKALFYKYGRAISVVWSPSSNIVALNDYYGSNVSRSFLFRFGPRTERIDVGERLAESDRPRREKLSIETADHVYPHVLRWIDRDRLLFKITGYNGVDSKGFTLVYLYNVRENSFSLQEFLHKREDAG